MTDMFTAVREVTGSAEASPPALFAETVVRVADLAVPPLRLPVGQGAFEYLEPALTARRAHFDAVRNG